jgi:hypothetical protein
MRKSDANVSRTYRTRSAQQGMLLLDPSLSLSTFANAVLETGAVSTFNDSGCRYFKNRKRRIEPAASGVAVCQVKVPGYRHQNHGHRVLKVLNPYVLN